MTIIERISAAIICAAVAFAAAFFAAVLAFQVAFPRFGGLAAVLLLWGTLVAILAAFYAFLESLRITKGNSR